MKRAISVWLPTFPIDLICREDRRQVRGHTRGRENPRDGRLILLATTTSRGQIVAGCDPEAIKLGVRPGLTISQAAAALTGAQIRVETHTPDRDADRLRALAGWTHRFSPAVAVDGPDGLLMDASGCAGVFRGEERMVRSIINALASLGFRARAAVASTFACAWAAARFGADSCMVVAPGLERDAIAPFPTSALRIEPEIELSLAEVGIVRIEHLLDLPRSVLPARFGQDLVLRLAQALGEAIETIDPVRPAAPARVERVFDGPTTQLEAVELTVLGLLTSLADRLRALESGARTIDLRLIRPGSTPVDMRLSLGRPNRNAKHLWSLLRPKLERANLGFGVEEVILTATRTSRLRHEQLETAYGAGHEDCPPSDYALGELIDTLVNRLGPEHVRTAALVESHIPERAFRSRVATDSLERAGDDPLSNAAAYAPSTTPAPGPRPSILLDHPVPVQVMALTPDGPVISVNWSGDEQRAVASIGPERISPDWWRSRGVLAHAGPTRDYFKVQDSRGRWLWVYRELQSGRWFVHGLWA